MPMLFDDRYYYASIFPNPSNSIIHLTAKGKYAAGSSLESPLTFYFGFDVLTGSWDKNSLPPVIPEHPNVELKPTRPIPQLPLAKVPL
jgi:hypothetical protein